MFFMNKCMYNNDFIRKTGIYFLILCIISYIIDMATEKGPRYWCLSSAILALILVII